MNTPLIDLADRRLGGLVLAASDEWFAPKEQLLDPAAPLFDPGRYSTRGKLMDGWETRRHSPTGDDWAIVRLGAPGVVRRAVIDTTHFRGNAPERCALGGYAAEDPLLDDARAVEWIPLLGWSDLRPDGPNAFALDDGPRVTHVRLQIAPDGGVARLRLFGEVVTDLRTAVDRHDTIDLAAAANGGVVETASGEFFSPAERLLQVGDARDMGDGWETRRRRDGGHDWVVVRLATTGLVDRVEVDTTHFLGNHPQSCGVDICHRPPRGDQLAITDEDWHEAVPTSPLGAHARHVFDVAEPRPATHVRLRIHPDGGVARLRVHGRVTDEGWHRAGVRWLDNTTEQQARAAFAHCCAASRWVQAMLDRRPYVTFDRLRTAADHEWSQMEHADWLEAFAAHPRIGDRSGPEHTRQEQAGTADADPDVLDALTEGNRRYERQFGHVFLINAAGRSADDMLRALHERLENEADTEAAVAAEQQRQITQRRLEMMMRPNRERGS